MADGEKLRWELGLCGGSLAYAVGGTVGGTGARRRPRPLGQVLSPRSRLSGKLAHAEFLQMSNGLALEVGLPVFAAAAFAA